MGNLMYISLNRNRPDQILYFDEFADTICCGSEKIQRGDRSMNDETQETQALWEESHPWLSSLTQQDEDDSLDEVIRYTLDELRFA